MASKTISLVEGSIEYIYADIRADRVLDDQGVYISISPMDAPGEWTRAVWVGNPGKFRSARVLFDGTLPQDTYWVFARIDDISESPIIFVGKLKVT